MSIGILLEGDVAIPTGIDSLAGFRRWALSEEFPERGRIDYIDGVIEVDLMLERVSSHGEVTVELARVISNRVRQDELGKVLIDPTRVSSPLANLSCEPDILVLSHESLDSGRARLVPSADGRDFVEIEGPPDLVVEIVSPSSVGKDTRRLPRAYFNAGVREFWLIDARRDDLVFRIQHRGKAGFEDSMPDADGFCASAVLSRRYRLDRQRGRREEWRYELREAE